LKLNYEIKNRLNAKQDEDNAVPHASRRILELSEDFFQISSFCGKIKALQVEMVAHAAGVAIISNSTVRAINSKPYLSKTKV
jgi:hypothetical protein